MSFFKSVLATAAAGLFAVGSAHAAASLSQAIVPGTNLLSDDNAELVLKYDAALNAGAGGYRAFNLGVDTIDVKDILVGIVKITSFPTGALGTSSNLYNEITGFYAVEALTAAPAGAIASCLHPTQTTCKSYTFGAANLASATDPLNAVRLLMNANYGTTMGVIANTGANSFASVFEDTTPDFNRATGAPAAATYNAAFASATDGTQRFVFDILPSTADYFFANGASNPAQLGSLPGSASGGGLGAKGTVSYQNVPDWLFGSEVTITGNIAKAGAGPFGIWTDSTYELTATRIPEPGSLALVGLALAGIGLVGVSRRKQVS